MRSCRQCRDAKRKCIPGKGSALSAPCDRCQLHRLPCSHSQANLLRTRTLNARRPGSQSPTESQTRAKRVDDFLADDGSVAVLVHEYLSKIHGRPHSIFHDATLWRDIRGRQASRALILAICAMGAHVSNHPTLRALEPLLTAESKRLLQIDLEHVCLANIQTCILVANLCVAHANPSSEFLFFRTAIAMMQLMESRTAHCNDNPVSHELRIRIWWALFAADNWCSSSLGFPRQMRDWTRPARLPMDERLFADMTPDEPFYDLTAPCRSPGLWAHMATLTEVFSPIQELNWRAANSEGLHPDQIEQDTDRLAQQLDDWQSRLPGDVQLTESNLIEHSKRGTGGTFMGLHLGFHHYATLLFYQYLDTRSTQTVRARQFAARCKHHALSYSTWLARGRKQPGCEAVYPTVGHMAIVSSSVLLHTLLFGGENELPQSRHCLEANFEALLELGEYWPIVKTMINRLMEFQNNCLLLSHHHHTHRLDRWMVRFLFEYALPLEDKAIDPHTALEMEIISTQAHIFTQNGRLPAFGPARVF
ncbi:hypothetical protein Asppvi_000071 [Aspergillus pseudoviridinutans]|uniref:Zn(2)-C6 fungal-type domain-containing protein n=1 Tax=Aspergillus pseudoviridinutans TaxID=1517512 RepID=A0A9P3B192_9EURO|nr:uncharacterized protein Asppvi_000071 [Aspergillus pseudoviridinutans]GIJ81572.1 hypothetical protein Asppvi_000071 [Aspergillus pseudoviridinutans]